MGGVFLYVDLSIHCLSFSLKVCPDYLSVHHLAVYPSVQLRYMHFFFTVYPFGYLSVFPSTPVSLWPTTLPVYLPGYLSVSLFTCMSICPISVAVYLPDNLSLCSPVYLIIYLSIFLYIPIN
ncbi:hypothetical protein DNTS_035255, partial [Danionella cerebrum]